MLSIPSSSPDRRGVSSNVATVAADAGHRPCDGAMRADRLVGRASLCRTAHAVGHGAAAARRDGRAAAAAERWGFYGAWAALAGLITGARAATVVRSIRHISLPVKIDFGIVAMGGISSAFCLIESGLAFKRFHDGRCRLRKLTAKAAARASAAMPHSSPVCQGWRRMRLAMAKRAHKRTTLAMARDGVVQLPCAIVGALGTAGHFVARIASALPWLGVVGNVFSIGMSVAHIATGYRQQELALRDIQHLKQRRARLRAAMKNLQGHPGKAVCGANGTDGDDVLAAEAAALRLAAVGLDEALCAARKELRQSRIRMIYGAASLVVNATALALAAAAMAGVVAATGGTAVAVAGGALSVAWLVYANRRLKPPKEVEPARSLERAMQSIDAADGASSSSVALQDAAAREALAQCCKAWERHHARASWSKGSDGVRQADQAYRYVAVAKLLDDLRGGGGHGRPDGDCADKGNVATGASQTRDAGNARHAADDARQRAMALFTTLGADGDMIASWQNAATTRECSKSMKMMLAFLEGKAVVKPGWYTA